MAKRDKKQSGKKADAEARGKSKKRDVKRPAGGVAPLAPPKFPDLPPVAGVRFATGSAGIKR
ncbi:MAG: hypothetical protein AAF914_05380, partial [Pseudomonadota bacterium]